MEAYLKLEKLFEQIHIVNNISNILNWDSAVIMPKGGHDDRTKQLCYLTTVVDSLLNSSEIADLIAKAKEDNNLDRWQRVNLVKMERLYKHEASVEKSLKEKFAAASANSEMIWREARKNDDFKQFLPSFKEVVKLIREIATVKAEAFNDTKYNVLLDSYDPGRKSEQIDSIFAELGKFLQTKIPEIIERQKALPTKFSKHYITDKQQALGKRCMDKFGFNFEHGRVDISHHPFCGGTHQDVRITARYDEKDFLSGLYAILHETGHALYEQNLPKQWDSQPIGNALGMSIHESQSLLVEMQLSKNIHFIKWLEGEVKKEFGDCPEHSVNNIYNLVNKVERSLIRVDADEVTYPCHIIMRYNLEQKIINNELEVEDLPTAWNEEMKKYLQITPPNNKDGCMQDIHWPAGLFGYFPCYTLGAIIAAQLFSKLGNEVSNINEKMEKGEFADIFNWLHNNIHNYGSSIAVDELLTKVTGKALDVENYKNYIIGKYLTL